MPKSSFTRSKDTDQRIRTGVDRYLNTNSGYRSDDYGKSDPVDYGPGRLKRADVKNPSSYVADKRRKQALPDLSKQHSVTKNKDSRQPVDTSKVGSDELTMKEWAIHERTRSRRAMRKKYGL